MDYKAAYKKNLAEHLGFSSLMAAWLSYAWFGSFDRMPSFISLLAAMSLVRTVVTAYRLFRLHTTDTDSKPD
ncbi:MAG: hypothetical protein FWG30_11200 [Eubacteriaceae bacterium]|jgi:hypothetical protein|nr:hypothetical protein [Eubacteriaceae bacterium]